MQVRARCRSFGCEACRAARFRTTIYGLRRGGKGRARHLLPGVLRARASPRSRRAAGVGDVASGTEARRAPRGRPSCHLLPPRRRSRPAVGAAQARSRTKLPAQAVLARSRMALAVAVTIAGPVICAREGIA